MPGSIGIIVLGPYRSGTSVTSQVLQKLGVDFGPKQLLLPAQPWNPGGFFERFDVNDANDALIRSAGRTLAEPGDPSELATKADFSTLKQVDMSWTHSGPLWGIKDPRMCASLLAWINAGILDRKCLKIIYVRRELGSALRSAMACEPVRNYCDGDEQRVRNMLQSYDDMAGWHVAHLEVPSLEVQFNHLITQPTETVQQLADFIGVKDPKRVRRATKLIGRGKGMFALQVERYFIRAPRRFFRFLTGRGPLWSR